MVNVVLLQAFSQSVTSILRNVMGLTASTNVVLSTGIMDDMQASCGG